MRLLIDASQKLPRLAVVVATAALLLLHGCGGGDDGATGATGPAGPAGPTGPAGPATVVNASLMSAGQFAATQFNATITSVTIASPPVVNFTVTDQLGNGVTGLGLATKSSTATEPRYQNLAFTLAKLIQDPQLGGGGPSRWVSYIVTTVPTTAAVATAQRPSTESNGKLVDNGNGTYKYTFYRDITQVKAQVDAMTLSGLNVAADLGDLSYQPGVIHRVVLQLSGNAPGTGTNTPNEVQVTPGVPIKNPNNAIFDFIPATGQTVAVTDPLNRLIVDKLS